MAWPINKGFLTTLRAAVRVNQPPSAFFGIARKRKPGKYLDVDYELVVALQIYEDSLCPDCRQPSWMSYDERNTGEFELETVTCEGCATREAESDKKSPPGEKSVLHNHLLDPVSTS